eukprot:gene10237-11932_t
MFSGEVPKEDNKPGPSTTPLTKAQFCKSLLRMRKSATLSSVDMLAKMQQANSSPVYGSIVPYALIESTNEAGLKELTPVVLIRKGEPHLNHFRHFSKVSLVVYPLTPVDRPPAAYALRRVNFAGRAAKISEAERKVARESLVARHPGAARLLDNGEAEMYTVTIGDIYHYERTSTSRVDPTEFRNAKSDEVCVDSRDIIETLNGQHTDALRLICEQYGDIQIDEAFVYFVDSAGLNCIAKRKSQEEWFDVRVPFDAPFANAKECKIGLIETIKDLKEKHLR